LRNAAREYTLYQTTKSIVRLLEIPMHGALLS
jgi:hypothetical protein